MFGSIHPTLTEDQKTEYRKYYCGLCDGLGKNCGFFSRVMVNYDLCLTYLVADSITANSEHETSYCPFFPLRKVHYYRNAALQNYIAAVNYLFAYHKVKDDIVDDGSMRAVISERLLRHGYERISERMPAASKCIEKGLASLHSVEKRSEYISIKVPAAIFGELLQDVMAECITDPIDRRAFSLLFYYLGMWVYVVDACEDLEQDISRKRYNPISAGMDGSIDEILSARKSEIVAFLLSCQDSMLALIQVLSFTKNSELIQSIFEHLLPCKVAKILQ